MKKHSRLRQIPLLFGEILVFIPIVRKVKEQQKIENEKYYKSMQEYTRIYDPTPENLFRVRANASPNYLKMTYRERASFDLNKLLSLPKSEKGVAFEEYISKVLVGMGYHNVSLTRITGDYGADIIAKNGNLSYAIQCKCYQNSVGVDAIYQVLGGALYYNANRPIVITTGYFTNQAKELANKSSVILVDRNQLIDIVEKYYSEVAKNCAISKGF